MERKSFNRKSSQRLSAILFNIRSIARKTSARQTFSMKYQYFSAPCKY